MTKYRVALLDVFVPEVLAEVQTVIPPELELLAVKTPDEDEKLRTVADADFILAGWASVSAQVMDAAPKLKLIQKWGIGVDKFDLKAAAARGIPVAIIAGGNAIPVSEHAVHLMLSVYRRLPFVDRSLRQGRWLKAEVRPFSFQLNRKVVGLIGFGNIGREVAKRVRVFNSRVIYYDMVRPSPEVEAELGVEYRSLDELFAQSDIISVHVPLTEQTRKLVNARAFSLMKPNAILVNTARGGVVDEAALIETLRAGRILGAGLDVFEQEPPEPGNPLMEMDNVVVTPHIAGVTFDNVPNMANRAFANMLKVVKGEPLSPADIVVSP